MWFPMATDGPGGAKIVDAFPGSPKPRRMQSNRPVPLPSGMASSWLSTALTDAFATVIPMGMIRIRLADDSRHAVEAGGNTGLLSPSRRRPPTGPQSHGRGPRPKARFAPAPSGSSPIGDRLNGIDKQPQTLWSQGGPGHLLFMTPIRLLRGRLRQGSPQTLGHLFDSPRRVVPVESRALDAGQ
jgi:hypothetical protein